MPATVIMALGTPKATVSPSAAPVRVKFAVVQVLGFSPVKVTLNAIDRCSTMGVPPAPMRTLPAMSNVALGFTVPMPTFTLDVRR